MPHVENKFCLWSIDNKMWVHNINIYHKFDKNSWKPLTGQLTFTECLSVLMTLWPNVSITPNTAMGCRQCLPLSVVQLKGKHCRRPHCRNGVVDTFGQKSSQMAAYVRKSKDVKSSLNVNNILSNKYQLPCLTN